MSLWEISTELQGLLAVCDAHGARSAEIESALADHIGALQEAFDAKADDYAALIRLCDARAQARSEEARRLLSLADADMVLAQRLREGLLRTMQAIGREKVETARSRIAVRRNGGAVPIVIEDESAIPSDFQIPKVAMTIDRTAIRDVLERGGVVNGARLGERGVRLDLR